MHNHSLEIALEHHRAGRLQEAEARYRQLLAENPSDPEPAHWLGLLILQSGRPAEAVPLLEKAVELRPEDAAFQNNLAEAYLRCGRRDEAVTAFDRAVSLDPRPELLMSAAMARVARQAPGDAEAAVELLTKAQSAGLGSPELHQNRGLALLLANRNEEAVKECQLACEMMPQNAEAFHNLAAALSRIGETANARVCLAQALELNPRYARPCFALAVMEAAAGGLIQADALFRAAISMKPDSAAGYHALGLVLAKMGQQQEAEQATQAATALSQGRSPQTQSVSQSIAEFEKRLTASPEAAKLHMLLAVKANVAPPAQLPPGSVTSLFDRYADFFDEHLRGKLEYHLPERIVEAIAQQYEKTPLPRPPDVLDLGCGTGICGQLLRQTRMSAPPQTGMPAPHTLSGVDASPAMIEKARARRVYDELEVSDLVETIGKHARSFDLLIAADVLIYTGDLLPTFEAAARSLRAGGLFAFSVEACEGDRFKLQLGTRRFTHSKGYVQKVASMCGFEELRFEPVTIRMEAKQPVQGYMVLLRLQ
jgi:predicted TPR repeat methyltransferase